MSIELPSGWALAKIPDLVGPNGVFSDGDWVESEDQDPSGDVRLIQLADVGDGYYVNKSNRFLTKSKARELNCTFLKSGDVLVARMPDPLGRACIFPGDQKDAVTVVDVCVIRGELGHIDHQWLMHFINSPALRTEIHALQSGSTRKRISRGNLSTIPIPVPPRAEQTRIVEKLEELLSDLDAGVAELKAAQRKLAQYRQSLLKAAMEGALTADWRAANGQPQESGADLLQRILSERRTRWEQKQLAKFAEQGKAPPKNWKVKYPVPVGPDFTSLPPLPLGWVWASVDQVGEVQLGKMLDKAKHKEGTPLSYLRNVNVRWGSIDASDLLTMNFEEDELHRFGLQIGDVLVCEGGEPGRAAACGPEHLSLKYQKALHRVRLFDAYVPDLLVSYLEHAAKSGLLDRSFTGSTIQHFTRESFIELPIPLPPREEQDAIVATLTAEFDRIREMEQSIKLSLKQAIAQRKNILKSAFAGQLVPQHPNDEPASELLARIRAARAPGGTTTASKRGRKAKGSV